MSVKLSAYVWDGCAAAGLKISAVAIMARLADFSSDEGLCWPSIATIARQLGAGESTVRTTLGKLEADGWVSSTQRRKGNRNTSNMYQLNIAKLRAAAEASDSDTSKSDTSNSDRSKSDASKSNTNTGFHPPESEGDPLVNSKPDPSEIKTPCPSASQPDDSSDESFLALHPEAVVFNAKKRKWGSADDLTAAEWIWGKIIRMYEQAAEGDGEIARPKEPDMTMWANEIRLMCVADGRNHKQICELFGRANRDTFWCKNILSPSKLREKWDDLTIKLSTNVAASNTTGGHWNSAEAWENTL